MSWLKSAAEDLRYLLMRGYPRAGAVTYIGNHYQLPRHEREIIKRGVYPPDEASSRRQRLCSLERLEGRVLGIDGHNVLITLESAIIGRELIESDDGLIRDIAGVFRSYRPSTVTEEALELLISFVIRHGVRSLVFYLDAGLSLSGELAAQISAVMAGRGLMGRAWAVPAPDRELASFAGLVATSDSILIDRVAEPVDLAGGIIRSGGSGRWSFTIYRSPFFDRE